MRNPRRDKGRTFRLAAVLLALATAASACSSGGSGDPGAGGTATSGAQATTSSTEPAVVGAASPIPVSADALPAGTDLGDGFRVPEGAVLLGPATPIETGYTYFDVPVLDRGWNATMVVPGDPRDVIADLQQQARASGMELHPGDDHEGGTGDPLGFCRVADRGYVCAARGSRGTREDTDFIDVELVRRDGMIGSPPVSHLWLQYSDSDRPLLQPLTADPQLPLGPEPPPVPEDWDELPGVGDRALAGVLPDGFPGIEILEGSRLIGPAADPQAYADYDLRLALDEDRAGSAPDGSTSSTSSDPTDRNDRSQTPAQAAAYRSATAVLADVGGEELFWSEPRTTPDGTLVRRVSVDEAGGFKFEFLVVEPEDGPATLVIDTGYD